MEPGHVPELLGDGRGLDRGASGQLRGRITVGEDRTLLLPMGEPGRDDGLTGLLQSPARVLLFPAHDGNDPRGVLIRQDVRHEVGGMVSVDLPVAVLAA